MSKPSVPLTPEQMIDIASLGAPLGEVRDFIADGYTFDQIHSIYAAQRSARQDERKNDAQVVADASAKAHHALEKHEEEHKGISAYSYPEGDIARPRPDFECKTIWVAEELTHDLTSAEEIELLNQVKPGRYIATRADNSKMLVTVTVEADEVTGKPGKKTIFFSTRGHLRFNLPPRTVLCRELIAQYDPASAIIQ
jgi:hypothetical protein